MAHHSLRHHRKLAKLARSLAMQSAHVVGHLMYLWWVVYDTPAVGLDGVLRDWDEDDIESAAAWEGERGRFATALLEAGFLERNAETFVIHDYKDWVPEYVRKRLSRLKTPVCPDNGGQCLPLSGQRLPTQPNATQRNAVASASADAIAAMAAKPHRSEPADGLWGRGKIRFDPKTATWHGITELDRTQWAASFPGVDLSAELAKAAAWCAGDAKTGRRSRYERFLLNWFNKTQDRQRLPSMFGGNDRDRISRVEAPPGKYDNLKPACRSEYKPPGTAAM